MIQVAEIVPDGRVYCAFSNFVADDMAPQRFSVPAAIVLT